MPKLQAVFHICKLILWGCILVINLIPNNCWAQPPYAFPVPGSEGLTGTFGEMRANHYHFGLDIRVFSRWGVPIIAAADGYVSRVRTFYNGYGKALYITHANNYQTVYGHLERYSDAVEARMYDTQKKTRQFNQDLFFLPHEFKVKQGDTIGFSGSTGGSSGPHLHFEVRDPQERILNPMSYFKKHLPDPLPPFITRIGIEPLEHNSRINKQYDKLILTPVKYGNNYSTQQVIEVKGAVGIEFTGYDRLLGAPNYNGIYSYTLKLDNQTVFECQWDRFHFDDSRYILQHTDYNFFHKYDGFLQKCYLDKGNKTPAYPTVINKGIIQLNDDAIHTVTLSLKDYHGNTSTWTGKLKRSPQDDKPIYNGWKAQRTPLSYEIKRNVVVFQQSAVAESLATLEIKFKNGSTQSLPPTYTYGGKHFTLFELTPDLIPTQAQTPDGRKVNFQIYQAVEKGKENNLSFNDKARAYLSPNAVFETIYFDYQQTEPKNPNACSPVYTIGNAKDPLFEAMALRIFPDRNTDKFKPEQMVLLEIRPNGSTNRFVTNNAGATLAKRMGKFCLIGDATPPVIRPVNFINGQKISRKKTKKLILYTNDAVAEVNPYKVEAEIDGQWTLVEYYEYTHTLFYYIPADLAEGTHTLSITITDYAGNRNKQNYTFVLGN